MAKATIEDVKAIMAQGNSPTRTIELLGTLLYYTPEAAPTPKAREAKSSQGVPVPDAV